MKQNAKILTSDIPPLKKPIVVSGLAVRELSDYLPLGSFIFHNVAKSAVNHVKSALEWIELSSDVPSYGTLMCPHNDLAMLLRAHWLRVFCLMLNDAPEHKCITWRLYILPDDVSLNRLSRSHKPLRKALDTVLSSELNISAQAWQGQHVNTGHQCFDRWATGEDSSLYYLFNMLPSPAPSSSLVRNRYSRHAIDILIKLQQSIRGLRTSTLR